MRANEGRIVDRELVISGRDTPTLLDLVEEPFDQVASAAARQAPSRAAHILLIVVRDAGSVLVHAHDGGIDHLHRRVMTGGQRFHDPVPYASLPPTNKAIIASGAGTMGFRQIAPGST
jgi:hypothetical protein